MKRQNIFRNHRQLERRFRVYHSTVSGNRRQFLYEKVKKAPKIDSGEQERRARKNFYRKLLNDDDLIIDNKNLPENNALGNRYLYSIDPSAA